MADSKSVTAGAVATPEETAEYRKAADAEWNTWVALAPISYNGAAAYNPGDPVPASNVERHGYEAQGLVGKAGNKEAQAVVSAIHNATSAGQEQVDPVALNVTIKS